MLRGLIDTSSWAALVILGGLTVTACKSVPHADAFQVGMSRQQVLSTFGEPSHREFMVKSGPNILGPIETFWSSVPRGSRVEIWSYPAAGGTVELYFVDDSARVQGTGFAVEGAVY